MRFLLLSRIVGSGSLFDLPLEHVGYGIATQHEYRNQNNRGSIYVNNMHKIN